MNDAPELAFRTQIGHLLGVAPDRISLFGKGRVALYALLRALDVRPGDEVILPAFTCVAVPNAIIYAGARPVWVDIDAGTYTIDPDAAAAAITPRTRAILGQNTFGLDADMDSLTSLARRHRVALIDDCTHGLGGTYRGRASGSIADLAFFSTQWSKPISTGLGGFSVARDEQIARRVRALEDGAHRPSAATVAVLRALIIARERAGSSRLLGAGRAVYRDLSRMGIVPGSSSGDELAGPVMPDRFLAQMSRAQARLGAERMGRLAALVDRRTVIAGHYSAWLREHGHRPAPERADSRHAFLRYPVLVTDRAAFLAAGRRAGIDVGDWFVSAVHPVVTSLERWAYRRGVAPKAEAICQKIVNLPTDPAFKDSDVERVLRFLQVYQHLIEGRAATSSPAA
jgi:perosamine synthetase